MTGIRKPKTIEVSRQKAPKDELALPDKAARDLLPDQVALLFSQR